MRLPYAWADRAQAHTVFHESTLASGTAKAREINGFIRGSRRRASSMGISSTGMPAARHPSTNRSAYSGVSMGVVTNSPPVSSMQSAAIRRRMRFSWMHSSAALGSFTTYRPPEWRSPWNRPVVPVARSPRSTRTVENPRIAASLATPTPVEPPPMTSTSVENVAIPSILLRGAFKGARGAAACRRTPRPPPHELALALVEGALAVLLVLLLLALGEIALLVLLVILLLALGEIALAVLLRVLGLLAGREVALLVVLHRSLPSEGDAPSGLPGIWVWPGTVFVTRLPLLLHPVERAGDGLLPLLVLPIDLGLVHPGAPVLVLAPVGPEVVDLLPEPDGQARRVGRAERGGLCHGRPDHRHAEDIGLELHQEVVVDHPAVDLQLLQRDAGVRVHGIHHLAGLPCRGLQGRPGDVALGDVPGEPHDRAACVASPVRGEQPGEGRDEVDPAVVLHGLGEILHLGRGLDQPQVIPQPLHEGTGDGDGPLKAVHGGLAADLVPERRQQAALGLDGRRPRVQEQEVPRPVGVLRIADVEGGLTEHRRLLVAEVAGHRDPRQRARGLPVDLARGLDLRQHGPRDTHDAQDLVVPIEGLQVHEHGPAGVGHVGDVRPAIRAAGEVPDAPAVDVAEQDLAPLAAILCQVVADLVGPSVLPHDRVVDRLARGRLPYHRGFPLVRDTHCREVTRLDLGLLQATGDHILGALPDLHRVVLDQPGLRIDLLVLLLVDPDHFAAVVEDHEPRAGRALVQRSCILRHGASLSSSSSC